MASNVFHTEKLRDKFNEWFETISKDGTFDEIYGRWIGVSLPDEKDISRFELTGENGTLKVCNTGNFPPFSYVDSNNQPVGFDEEILSRFAAHLGMDIEYNMMAYDAIIPYVLSGKADMSACSFTVTDERLDGVIFGTAFTKARIVLVIKKSDTPAAARDYTSFAGKRFGAYEGKNVKFTDLEFGGLIPYIVSKKADIALANMAITEERKKSVLFTEPFFDEQHAILALKADSADTDIKKAAALLSGSQPQLSATLSPTTVGR